jgi:hypothetical protein
MTKKNQEWVRDRVSELMADFMVFSGPEYEYQRYMSMRLEQALTSAVAAPSDLELEEQFEAAFERYKQKNPNFSPRDAVLFELAFFEAAKYIIKY